MDQNRTAILYFSRNLQDEFEAKGFGMSFHQFRKLYQFLQTKVLTVLHETGIPVIESYSTKQVGDGFGERLTFEIEKVKALGYQSVIVIGNDVPQLSLGDLKTAHSNLHKGVNTIGADHRGGAYLIAFSFNNIRLSALRDLNWQSSFVYEQLRGLLIDPEELKAKTDFNNKGDVIDLIESKSLTRGVVQFLISLNKENHLAISLCKGELMPALRVFDLRGPPMQFATL